MRGLLMIEPLYHQTVKGNKTQTRRSGGLEEVNKTPDEYVKIGTAIKDGACFSKFDYKAVIAYPRYKVGEVLYLKEPTALAKIINGQEVYAYRYGCNGHKGLINKFKWENKLFMPSNRARSFVNITGIKCERLLDISDADCIAEGIEVFNGLEGYYQVYDRKTDAKFTEIVKRSFFSLYRFANKMHGGSIPNQWVWVYNIEYLPNYKINA